MLIMMAKRSVAASGREEQDPLTKGRGAVHTVTQRRRELAHADELHYRFRRPFDEGRLNASHSVKPG